MTAFWMVSGLLVLLALAFLLLPLFRQRPSPSGGVDSERPLHDEGQTARVDVYRTQLAELQSDLEIGTISEEQFQRARLDLQRNLLEATAAPVDAGRAGVRSWNVPVAILVAMLVPATAILVYLDLGEGERGLAASDPSAAPVAAGPAAAMGTREGIEAAVEALSQRLEENPDDPQGWAMLGRSLMVLGDSSAAAGAYAQAIRNGGGRDPDILVAYADLVGAIDGGDLSLRARQFIEVALEVAPDHANALWLGGLAAFHSGELDTTVARWDRLAQLFPAESDEGQLIRSNLAEVRALQAAAAEEAETAGVAPPSEAETETRAEAQAEAETQAETRAETQAETRAEAQAGTEATTGTR